MRFIPESPYFALKFSSEILTTNSVVWSNFTDVSEVFAASIFITLMVKAVSTFETSVNVFQTTRLSIPEDLYIRRGENMNSYHLHTVLTFCLRATTYLVRNNSNHIYQDEVILPGATASARPRNVHTRP